MPKMIDISSAKENNEKCLICKSTNIIKRAEAKNPGWYEIQYHCQDCNSYWTDPNDYILEKEK